MSVPQFVDDRLASTLKCWHPAPGGRPGTVALTGRQFFADGDGVRVLIRVSGDHALASDAGITAVRLADAGVDIASNTRAATAWGEILTAFELREVDGRIVGRRPLGQAEQLASDIASAMLTADGLRWLAAPQRDSKLTRQLYAFLRDGEYSYSRRPNVNLPRGSIVRPTACVHARGRDVLIQAVGGDQGVDHAVTLMAKVDRADYDVTQRLVLLNGLPDDWAADQLDLLADFAPVGFSNRMAAVTEFLREGVVPPRPIEKM